MRQHASVLADALIGGVADARPGALHLRERHLELARMPPVVAVQKRDVGAARGRDAGIACRRDTRVARLQERTHARIAFRVAGDQRRGSVGRPVVDDQQLEFMVRLRQDRIDRALDRRRRVVRRHDDADARRRRALPFGRSRGLRTHVCERCGGGGRMKSRHCGGIAALAGFGRLDDVVHLARRDVVQHVVRAVVVDALEVIVHRVHVGAEQRVHVGFLRAVRVDLDEHPLRPAFDMDARLHPSIDARRRRRTRTRARPRSRCAGSRRTGAGAS